MPQPVVVSYGLGVDSTAMLVGMVARGWRPDLILFADVGDEKPPTYAYLTTINAYLKENDFPMVRVVKYVPKRFKYEPYSTLEGNCISNKTLPSLAFGGKSCSLKWKAAPMDKFVDKYEPFQEWIEAGGKITRLIGYDDGLKDSRRGATKPDPKYEYRYPLREWHWDRVQCIEEIVAVGLPPPIKSACFHCPSTQKDELLWLAKEYPDLARRAVLMEDNARPNLRAIEGLWRNGVKGTRKPASKRPGSWRVYLEQEGLLEEVMNTEQRIQLGAQVEDVHVEPTYGSGPELCRGCSSRPKRRVASKLIKILNERRG
jgi:hypothetical protein